MRDLPAGVAYLTAASLCCTQRTQRRGRRPLGEEVTSATSFFGTAPRHAQLIHEVGRFTVQLNLSTSTAARN